MHDCAEFSRRVSQHFSHCPAYAFRQTRRGQPRSWVASFYLGAFEIALFGQSLPTEQQHGYRHLVVEARLLAAGGAALRQKVTQLKAQGMKTEPAFAQLLALPGDPYQALLTLETYSAPQLRRLVEQGN